MPLRSLAPDRVRVAAALATSVCALGAGLATADVFELSAGGEVRGSLVERTAEGVYVVRTEDGAQVSLAKGDIARIVQVDDNLAEYRRRARSIADTADGQRELARWCKERGLAEQAELHFDRLLQLAPDDEEARVGLGYQKSGGRWMTRAEIMAKRGMILHEGKYRTPQDVALRQRDAAAGAVDADWFQKLRLWRGWLDSRRPQQSAEARALFDALDDPAAVPALVRLLDKETDDWAWSLLVKTLSRFDHPDALRTLVNATLYDARAEHRELALDLLTRDGRQVPLLPFVRALKNADNKVVNRAGKALAAIGDPEAVSPLIDALVTEHKFIVQQGSSGINAGSVNGNASFSAGGEGPKIIRQPLQNAQVLKALTTLAGQHEFDYDEVAWRSWFVNEQARALASARRDE